MMVGELDMKSIGVNKRLIYGSLNIDLCDFMMLCLLPDYRILEHVKVDSTELTAKDDCLTEPSCVPLRGCQHVHQGH